MPIPDTIDAINKAINNIKKYSFTIEDVLDETNRLYKEASNGTIGIVRDHFRNRVYWTLTDMLENYKIEVIDRIEGYYVYREKKITNNDFDEEF